MSDHYRALTRTYRPTTFDEIVSQQHVSDTLKNAIRQNRLAHAYMFCGPRGVGKTTMARVLARTVNDIDAEVDGEGLNQTLNIVEIDAASNNSVDDIRDLRERVRIPPQNGRFKIYIIDEVHMLSKQAFNALLKTLEEPPDHIIFIFATTEPHKVLPTILSRVQRFDFKRISVEEIVGRLQQVAREESINVDVESLHVIAKKADGALRDALGLMDQAIAFCGSDIQHEELLRALNVVSTDRMFQFMEAVENNDAGTGLELINELLQEGYDIQEFLIGLTEHLRNLYIAKNSAKMHLVEASDETKNRYLQTSEVYTQDDLIRMMHIVSEAQYKIKEAQQPRIQFEIMLLKLIHMERSRNLNKLLNELEDLKKKIEDVEYDETDGSPAAGGRENGPDSPGGEKETAPDARLSQAPAEDAPVTEAGKAGNDDEAGPRAEAQKQGPKENAAVAVVEEPDQTEGAVTETEEEGEGEGESDFFGRPSLDGFEDRSPGNGTQRTAADGRSDTDTTPEEAADREIKEVALPRVQERWDEFLEALRQEVPQMLYFQMQRVDPIALKNRELTLRCNDDFAKKIVEENKRELGKILVTVIDVFLRFRCVVQKTEEENEETMSPYERFKQLQERDPTVKTLIELFNAELDYNLSR
ncbi:MAG: DNA polymerase III subunit gamma/tau [Balneolaceae bacterium]|nr:DNA polymerase III subunit gamma/tau [Balneolaceae bacterium]